MNGENEKYLERIRAARHPRDVLLERVPGLFPHLRVTVPDAWDTVHLAPLYDVHLGHKRHDAETFARHLLWLQRTPNVLTWNGGDLFENASKLSVGGGVYEQSATPQEQVEESALAVASISHKMLFAIPGNHEARAHQMGLDIARTVATNLEVPYFPDYCFCVIHWRGQRFRVLAHHGSGGAQTAGAQRMAARKDIGWAKPIDLFWTGHLHNPLVDLLYQTDVDQKTGEIVERTGLVVISPSYLHYFGTYAAANRMPPGPRGLAGVTLNSDGRIDAVLHANGRRL